MKHEIKKKVHEMWDKHGDKIEGFVTSGATGANTQDDGIPRPRTVADFL